MIPCLPGVAPCGLDKEMAFRPAVALLEDDRRRIRELRVKSFWRDDLPKHITVGRLSLT